MIRRARNAGKWDFYNALTKLNGLTPTTGYENTSGKDFKISPSWLLLRVKGSRRHGQKDGISETCHKRQAKLLVKNTYDVRAASNGGSFKTTS